MAACSQLYETGVSHVQSPQGSFRIESVTEWKKTSGLLNATNIARIQIRLKEGKGGKKFLKCILRRRIDLSFEDLFYANSMTLWFISLLGTWFLLSFDLVVVCFLFFLSQPTFDRIDSTEKRGAVGRGRHTVGRRSGRTIFRHGTWICRRFCRIISLFGLSRSSARWSQGKKRAHT